MKIYLPINVKYIIDKINDNGYESYIVGGCVRDSIIGFIPNDYDITTNATPNQIMDIFSEYKCIETGIEHGTVSILIDEEIFEITTYRVESEYKDHRRPEKIEYTSNLKEDLKRRDFTINAMAYNEVDGLVDVFGGIEDINARVITTVGNPNERFEEDGLRMIRAIRFSSKLNFIIDNKTIEAIHNNAHIIKNISLERITDEISKIITSDNPQNLIYLFETKLFKYLNISNENNTEKLEYLKNQLLKLKNIENNIIDRLAALEYIIEKGEINCNCIYKSLKYSKKINNSVEVLLKCLKSIDLYDLDKVQIKKILNNIEIDIFKTYLSISKSISINKKNNEIIDKIINILEDIEKNKECYKIKELDIKGTDIMKLGYKNKEIGIMLNYLLNEVIKDSNINKRDILIDKIKQL